MQKYLVICYSFFIVASAFYLMMKTNPVDFIAKEFQEIGIFSNEVASSERGDVLSFDSRYYINSCAYDIIKENPIIGVGVGDNQTSLNTCYLEKSSKLDIYKTIFKDNLNAHNQYSSYLISGGVVLLLLFISTLVYNARNAYHSNNYLYLFFIIIIAVNFMFENMMSRMYGVVFFSLIINMFGAKEINSNDKDRE
jgi:O-antigen ligase